MFYFQIHNGKFGPNLQLLISKIFILGKRPHLGLSTTLAEFEMIYRDFSFLRLSSVLLSEC